MGRACTRRYNPNVTAELHGFTAPTEAAARAFGKVLIEAGLHARVRIERGSDIAAACGQVQYLVLPPYFYASRRCMKMDFQYSDCVYVNLRLARAHLDGPRQKDDADDEQRERQRDSRTCTTCISTELINYRSRIYFCTIPLN